MYSTKSNQIVKNMEKLVDVALNRGIHGYQSGLNKDWFGLVFIYFIYFGKIKRLN